MVNLSRRAKFLSIIAALGSMGGIANAGQSVNNVTKKVEISRSVNGNRIPILTGGSLLLLISGTYLLKKNKESKNKNGVDFNKNKKSNNKIGVGLKRNDDGTLSWKFDNTVIETAKLDTENANSVFSSIELDKKYTSLTFHMENETPIFKFVDDSKKDNIIIIDGGNHEDSAKEIEKRLNNHSSIVELFKSIYLKNGSKELCIKIS